VFKQKYMRGFPEVGNGVEFFGILLEAKFKIVTK
jgi:hypothetical protein